MPSQYNLRAKMRNKSLIFILYTILIFNSGTVFGKTLHTILVADTVNDIGFATGPDLKQLQKETRAIASYSQMSINEKIFWGSEFEKSRVESYLNQLKVDSTDTVIFYFSGHGYRTHQKTTRWPNLNFDFYKPGLDFKWVIDTIRSKKPQFSFIVADCCNNYIEDGCDNRSRRLEVDLYPQKPNYAVYRQLFAHAKGCVAVCSSSEGQFSFGSHLGGLFTKCFLTQLTRESNQKNPNWNHLMNKTFTLIKKVQKPICEIYPD